MELMKSFVIARFKNIDATFSNYSIFCHIVKIASINKSIIKHINRNFILLKEFSYTDFVIRNFHVTLTRALDYIAYTGAS
jgi:hypothetical protein